MFFWFSVSCRFLRFSEYFPLIQGVSIATHNRISIVCQAFFWVLASRPYSCQWASFSMFCIPGWLKPPVTPLVCWLHKHLSKQIMRFCFFPVLNPHRLVISFIAFIHIVCCLTIYLHQTMQMGFVFFLRIFQDKCNRDCNRDYFQCNRNRLYLWCNQPMSDKCCIGQWQHRT